MMTSPSSSAAPDRRFSVWASLSLSRKLLAAFGVLFVLAVVIAVATLWGLNRVTTAYEDTLSQGVEIRRLSSELLSDLLQARRQEKNFLLRWRTEGYDTAYTNYVEKFKGHVVDMQQDLIALAPYSAEAPTASTGAVTQAQYEADLAELTRTTDTYERSYLNLVTALGEKGANENTGLELAMRDPARALEEQFTSQAGLENLEIKLLQIRRHEKDYLARGGQEYVDNVAATAAELRAAIAATESIGAAQKTEWNAQIDAYLSAFNAIVAKDQNIAANDAALIAAGRAVEPLAEKFNALGEVLATDDTLRARENSTQTITLSIVIVLVVLTIAVLLAVVLSRQLTRPISALTDTALEISTGKFDTQAAVTSADEIGTLASTFNVMTSRLGEAFEAVRRRALAVQTSAEVSRRLSVATNPRQLAVDVVEQVQEAFHYYHAHIYFLDTATGDLLMAGGTGEVGATLLARGHKVLKGRGLVGRAAATNASVLVADVSQAEGWLPNPLLPDTKSEAAIPIAIGQQVLGVLDVQQNIVNGLGDEDVELLQSLAGQVAISLQNARSFEQAKEQADLESLVNAIGQKIQRAPTVDAALQTAVREVGLALGASRVSANVSRTAALTADSYAASTNQPVR